MSQNSMRLPWVEKKLTEDCMKLWLEFIDTCVNTAERFGARVTMLTVQTLPASSKLLMQ
jgi:hypothetical protein